MTEEQGMVPTPPPAAGTPAGAKVAGKSKLPVILGVIVALVLVRWMFSGSSTTTHSAGTAASDGTSAAGDAPAAGGNPILGKWTLANPDDASYCATTQEFTPSTSKWTQNGQNYQMKPIYDIHPGGEVVTVGYGTSYMGDFRVNGPDDITEGRVGPPPYSIPSFCKYHRQ